METGVRYIELFDIRHIISGYVVREFANRHTVEKMIGTPNSVNAIKISEKIGVRMERYYMKKEQDVLSRIGEIFAGKKIVYVF